MLLSPKKTSECITECSFCFHHLRYSVYSMAQCCDTPWLMILWFGWQVFVLLGAAFHYCTCSSTSFQLWKMLKQRCADETKFFSCNSCKSVTLVKSWTDATFRLWVQKPLCRMPPLCRQKSALGDQNTNITHGRVSHDRDCIESNDSVRTSQHIMISFYIFTIYTVY